MNPISNVGELKQAIADLEKRKTSQEVVIKEQFALSKKALKPANVLKNTFARVSEIPEVRRTMINTIIGFGLGFLSKKTAKFLSEDSLNNMVTKLVDYSADHARQSNPEGLFSKSIHFARLALKEEVLTK
ncbi:hypothetical protein EXU57_11940 [Segetibacter sp. 3557_3]|uniref:hypothetical protein n=1 Tax=Segetibacter sp. 3557_3 TaxID=2547429 RepID=UPI001058D3B6|nr:hypothetical protein [Segetibacter sp. 3557_3]TDH26194.1 hypothetical protein EXU57_11940 [Segetibacter sp. 3557_3]